MKRKTLWARLASLALLSAAMLPLFTTRYSQAGKPGGGGTSAAYTFLDLQGLPGGNYLQSEAWSLNEPDAGGGVRIVGNSYVNSTLTPAFWNVNSNGSFTISNLGGVPVGAAEAGASDVNDLGVVTLYTERSN